VRPTKVYAGGVEWKVGYRRMNKDECGVTDYKKLRINVDGGMAESMIRRTLVHELAHVNLPWGTEEEILRMETVMCRIMLENPEVMKYIAGEV
jgi:hypothetical protein